MKKVFSLKSLSVNKLQGKFGGKMYGSCALQHQLYDTSVVVKRQILSDLPSKRSLLGRIRGEILPHRESLPSQTEKPRNVPVVASADTTEPTGEPQQKAKKFAVRGANDNPPSKKKSLSVRAMCVYTI